MHICYGYGIKANIDWKATLGGEWRQYEEIFPALAASQHRPGLGRMHPIPRCRSSCSSLLKGKDVLIGVIDVASDTIETPEDVAAVIETALKYVPKERIIAGTNCGMAPMRRDIAAAKLDALGRGAALARQRFRLDQNTARPLENLLSTAHCLSALGLGELREVAAPPAHIRRDRRSC